MSQLLLQLLQQYLQFRFWVNTRLKKFDKFSVVFHTALAYYFLRKLYAALRSETFVRVVRNGESPIPMVVELFTGFAQKHIPSVRRQIADEKSKMVKNFEEEMGGSSLAIVDNSSLATIVDNSSLAIGQPGSHTTSSTCSTSSSATGKDAKKDPVNSPDSNCSTTVSPSDCVLNNKRGGSGGTSTSTSAASAQQGNSTKFQQPKGFRLLPQQALTPDAIRLAFHKRADKDQSMWDTGKVSGTIYHGGKELQTLMQETYGRFLLANPLHSDMFNNCRQIEAEVQSLRDYKNN